MDIWWPLGTAWLIIFFFKLTAKDCNKLMKKFDFISCEANGTFSPRQCKNGRCFCVDTETGKRIEDIGSFPANRNVSCENSE